MDQTFLTSKEVADYLGIAEGTLRNWRYEGEGPKYVKLRKRLVRYRESDVKAYVDALPTAA